MDRVGWTRERNNCESWSSLDPDLLVITAKHCDATSVCQVFLDTPFREVGRSCGLVRY